MKRFFSGLLLLLTALTSTAAPAAKQPDIAEILKKGRASFAGVRDYTCVLHRRDVVDGVLKEHDNVVFKFRKPSQFYMRWPKGEIEAIYAGARYDNKMVIHGGRQFKFLSIAVAPEAALKYNRHTMPEADIGHIMEIMETNARKASTDRDASIIFERDETLGERKTWRFRASFPEGRGYYGHIVYINIDQELCLPDRIKVLGWKNELLEEYYYEDLKINTGLSDDDFDMNNRKYMFRIGY